ncbi:MAG: hypothetical protein RL072_1156 [Actinomycetota bacterium]
MVLFATGSFALWWAASSGWSSGVFRVFFTAGAVLNVPWLALGSVALIGGDRIAIPLRRVIATLSAFAIGVMVVAPAKKEFVATEFPRARDHFGAVPRILAAVGSGVPALFILVGALWSIWRLISQKSPALESARRRVVISTQRLVLSNVLVALGTVVLSASGTLAGRLGEEQAFSVTLAVGVVILFVGFMVPTVRREASWSAQSAAQHLAGTARR